VEALAETALRLQQQALEGAANRLLDEVRGRLVEEKRAIVNEFRTSGQLAATGQRVKQTAEQITADALAQTNPSTIAAGIAETVRRGRKAFAIAWHSQQPNDFHEWRKRAKDFRYQMSFLDRLWPHVLEAYSESARDLERGLGEEHNLSMLRDMLADQDSSQSHLRLLDAIFDREQRRLRRQAETIGLLLYSDKPKQWEKRIALCLDGH
jgi:CHAD domain-containing protein